MSKYIFCGDIHIRDKVPVNRIDDYMSTQATKLCWLLDLAKSESAIVVVAGDFFDSAKPSNYLLAWTIRILREYNVRIIVTPGNHDLPFHSMHHVAHCGLWVLQKAGLIEVWDHTGYLGTDALEELDIDLYCAEWGADIPEPVKTAKLAVLVSHRMIIDSEIFPGQHADYSKAFLRKNRLFDLIITGDNHQTIQFKAGNRQLFNAGSLMRMTTIQMEHKPCVGLWDSSTNNLDVLYIPIAPVVDVLDTSKAVENNAYEQKLIDFVQGVKVHSIHVSFEDNLKLFFVENEVEKAVKDLVWGCVGE